MYQDASTGKKIVSGTFIRLGVFKKQERETETKVYECWVCLVPEDGGGYSVFMPDLPGVVSQGETEEEAIHNIEEAFLGAAEVYEEMGQPIPWAKDHQPRPANAKERWILVNA